MDISELRSQIDAIDDTLIQLFINRMAVSAAIGDYKKQQGLPIHVPQREQEILSTIALKTGPEMAPYITRLYEEIFSLSREYQQKRNKEAQ